MDFDMAIIHNIVGLIYVDTVSAVHTVCIVNVQYVLWVHVFFYIVLHSNLLSKYLEGNTKSILLIRGTCYQH